MEQRADGIASRHLLIPAFLLSACMAALLLVVALPGAFAAGLYKDVPSVVAVDRGSDMLTAFGYVPAFIALLYLSYRGSLRAQVLWLGLVSWVAYYYAVYSFGISFTPLFLGHVAVMSLAVFTLAIVLRHADLDGLSAQFRPSMPRRLVAVYLWIVAAMFGFLWLADVIPATLANRSPSRLVELGATSNPVEVNDLAFVIPLLVLAGFWTWRRLTAGYLLAGILLGLAAATMLALIPGAPIFGGGTPDPVYTAVAVLSALVLALFLRSVGARAAADEGLPAAHGDAATLGVR